MGTKDDTSHYDGALLEDINDKLRGIADAVDVLAEKVEGMDRRLANVEQNAELLPVVKHAIKAQTDDHRDLATRVEALEQAAAA